jgi:hypothetical protein
MLKVRINKQKYVIKTLFHEVNGKDLKKAYTYLQEVTNNDLDLFAWLYKNKEANKASLFRFKKDWLSIFSDIPNDVLNNIEPESDVNLSLDFLFELTEKFIGFPNIHHYNNGIEFGKSEYELVKDKVVINGVKLHFAEGIYKQWKLANMLSGQIVERNNSNTMDALVQMAAVLYSDGDNSDEAIDDRIDKFWNLDASTLWGVYIYFADVSQQFQKMFPLVYGKDVVPRVKLLGYC